MAKVSHTEGNGNESLARPTLRAVSLGMRVKREGPLGNIKQNAWHLYALQSAKNRPIGVLCTYVTPFEMRDWYDACWRFVVVRIHMHSRLGIVEKENGSEEKIWKLRPHKSSDGLGGLRIALTLSPQPLKPSLGKGPHTEVGELGPGIHAQKSLLDNECMQPLRVKASGCCF